MPHLQPGGPEATLKMSQKLQLPQLRYRNKFRVYQRQAIDMVRRYRTKYYATAGQTDQQAGAALVCHPTGTGKTAVIAGLAQAAPEIGNVLILTTREAIRDQLSRELSGNIFIESTKFNLGTNIRLAKSTYVVSESRMLDGQTRDLHQATCKLFTPELFEFATKQFRRLVEEPTEAFAIELQRKRSIIVMTVQMLVGLAREHGTAYKALQDHLDIVLFDEGHYEPAAQYSIAVRSLGKAIALMSATPFRNDLKPFLIKASNIHIYKFTEAVNERVIRDVTVDQRPPTRDVESFCDDIINYCQSAFDQDWSRWPRIIVHCDDMGSIARLGEGFIRKGFKDQVVGIHDRFLNTREDHQSWQHQAVPPPRQTNALIWIHQYKLMEGIDDHRFRVLAFFDPLKNVRSVVQQIGRVIRATPGEQPMLAIVLDHYRGRIRQYWDLYMAYDKSTSVEYLTKTMSRFYLDKFTEIHPEIDYIDRKFRGRLDLRKIKSADDEILFDRRVTLKRIDPTATMASFTDLIDKSLAIEDYEFSKYPFDDDAMLYVCAKVGSPDFLNTLYFAEPRHGARLVILLRNQGILAITSTGTGTGAEGLGHLESVGPEKLELLLMPGSLGRINSVSSLNTNLGNRVVRRRTISAPSIADVPPILDEHGHIVSIVTGYNGTAQRIVDDIEYLEFVDEDLNIVTNALPSLATPTALGEDIIRRYIGIASGRVSEQGPPLRLKAFRQWVESLVNQMQIGERYNQVYSRYAALSVATIKNGAAKNLLLDILDLADQYEHKDTGENIRGDELCVDRTGPVRGTVEKPTSRFSVIINGLEYAVDVVFNRATQRYKLESSSLDTTFIRVDGRNLSLCRMLNDSQSFNIIPDDKSVIYVHGRFYAPGLKFGSRFSRSEFFVGHCLYPAQTFKDISSEKGATVSTLTDDYDRASLFGLIDGWKNGFDTMKLGLSVPWVNRYNPEPVQFTPTLCICDDTNKESADFILADKLNRRVVLVHAKASASFRKYSASAVQEVCAQAQKNTSLFSTYSLQRPGNYELWDQAHNYTGDGKVSLTITNRIRKPLPFSAQGAWDILSELLHNPLTTREIWLVLGNMLSAETLYEGLQSNDPKPETLQLNHLLQTTIAAAGSVGAKTRIFCAP